MMSVTNFSSVIDEYKRNNNHSNSSSDEDGDDTNGDDELKNYLEDNISELEETSNDDVDNEQSIKWPPRDQESELFNVNEINGHSAMTGYPLGFDQYELSGMSISTIIEEDEEGMESEKQIPDLIRPLKMVLGSTITQQPEMASNDDKEKYQREIEISEDRADYHRSSSLNGLPDIPLPLDLYSKDLSANTSLVGNISNFQNVASERNEHQNNNSSLIKHQNDFLLSGSDKERWEMLYETRGKEIDNLRKEINNLKRANNDMDSKIMQELKHTKSKLEIVSASEKHLKELLDAYETKVRENDVKLMERESINNKLEIYNRSLKSELDSAESTIRHLEETVMQLKTVESLSKNKKIHDKFITKLQNTSPIGDLDELTTRYNEAMKKMTFFENEARKLQSELDTIKENYSKEIDKKDSIILLLNENKQNPNVSIIQSKNLEIDKLEGCIRNVNETHAAELFDINSKNEEGKVQNKMLKDEINKLQLVNEKTKNECNRYLNEKNIQLTHLLNTIENYSSDTRISELNAKNKVISSNLLEIEKQLNNANKNLSYYEIVSKMESGDRVNCEIHGVDLNSLGHSKRKHNNTSKFGELDHRKISQELLSVVLNNRNLKKELEILKMQNKDNGKLVGELNNKIQDYEYNIYNRIDEIQHLNEKIIQLQLENKVGGICGEVTSTEESSDRVSMEIEKWKEKLQAQIETNALLKKSHDENINKLICKLKETINAKNSIRNRSFNHKMSMYENQIKKLDDEKKSLRAIYEDDIRNIADVLIDKEGELKVSQEKYKNDIKVFSDTVNHLNSERDKLKEENKQLGLHLECNKETARADIKKLRKKYELLHLPLQKDLKDSKEKVMYYYKISKKLDGDLDQAEKSYNESQERHNKAHLDIVDWLAKSRQSILKCTDIISTKINNLPIVSDMVQSLISSVSRVITQVSNLRIQIEQ